MSTYLRRLLVPKNHLPAVINQVQENYAHQFMVDTTNIGGFDYGIIKAISSRPMVAWVHCNLATTYGDLPSENTMAAALKNLYASDLDLKATISENTETLHSAGEFSKYGWTTFTYTVVDANGVSATVDVPIFVADDVKPVITAEASITATNAECLAGTWVPIATAADACDGDLSENIVITYFQEDGSSQIPDLFGFNTYLFNYGDGAVGKVKFNVTDAADNAAVEVVQTVTAGPDITPPVITLVATAVNIALADVATWDQTTNVASATDDVDGDIKFSGITYSFFKFNGDVRGDALATLSDAKTWLGTPGNKVEVVYNASDSHNNAAVTKTCVYTSVAE